MFSVCNSGDFVMSQRATTPHPERLPESVYPVRPRASPQNSLGHAWTPMSVSRGWTECEALGASQQLRGRGHILGRQTLRPPPPPRLFKKRPGLPSTWWRDKGLARVALTCPDAVAARPLPDLAANQRTPR